MSRHPLLGTTCLSLAAFAAAPAAADVTAADVWASYVSYYEATGAEVLGTPQADGDTTTITGNGLVYRFPFDTVTVRVDLPELTLTNQGDGTVAIGMPASFDVGIAMDIQNEGSGSGTLSITQSGFSGMASGDPGAVSFTQSSDDLRIEVTELNIPGEDVDFVMQLALGGYNANATVTEGDLITVTSDVSLAAGEVATVVSGPDGVVSSSTGTFGASQNQSEFALPAGGSDLLNLSAALRAGAYIRGATQSEGNTTEAITTIDNQVISEQISGSAGSAGEYSFDADGLTVSVQALENTFRTTMPDVFPFPIEGSIGSADFGLAMPLLPSEDAQDAAFKIGFEDIVVSDMLWDMIDPTSILPRDPATVIIDLEGQVLSDVEWLNFETFEDQFAQGNVPLSPESVTINSIAIDAIGANANATGAFTFDITDMETFPGFPRPQGDALLEVSGANTLLDRLSELGVIGPDEMNMARFGLGFIARSTGDDSFETAVEVTEDGRVMVNGQRMR